MSGTQRRPALASYRDAVAERIRAGEPFGEVEDSIDEVAELTMRREGRAVAVRLLATRSR